jgi:NosR/NirI family nitrous oxide reductase transcriptional regulator
MTSAISPALSREFRKYHQLALAHIVPDAIRCMQCGICSYNCPAGIDVRSYAWRGEPIDDSHCLTCRECVLRCLRRALHIEAISRLSRTKG